jgi:hypothetical protein
MTDKREIQRRLFDGDLYRTVKATEVELQHGSEHDLGSVEERQFALLCWALEKSSKGGGLTLSGALEALDLLVREFNR